MKSTDNNEHVIVFDRKVAVAEEGFILGNGDISVSIYQKRNKIIWRFGKGDVWDRRLMTDEDPAPMTMDELRHGIAEEGWSCPAYGGDVVALKGTKHPKRTYEVLQNPPSLTYPYPMPKPVGELSLRWPGDLRDPVVTQKLFIEKACVEIVFKWPDGERLDVNCFVHPSLNVLVVDWNLSGFDLGAPQPFFKDTPICLSLYRWADPTISEFAAKWKAETGNPAFDGFLNPKATPLPPPEVIEHNRHLIIEQKFYEDKLFPGGFGYWLGCITDQQSVEKIDTGPLQEARLLISPETAMDIDFISEYMNIDKQLRDGTLDYPEPKDYQGWVAIPLTTSSDEGGPERQFEHICDLLKDDPESVIEQWKQQNQQAARKFWSSSAIDCSEQTIENLWYELLHVSRCIYREGTIPPALYMPSTINDYSMWHSDYHSNYNIQQPFWGFLTANHPELDRSYFKIAEFFEQIGRKIARDYCGTRGMFIQIGVFPLLAEDDTFATGPMGRMPYMTGYFPEQLWWHYLYTQDIEYLRDRGYPFLRDCALFFTDYLELREDGKYHAFPSCWGEEPYNGTVEKNTDALQTIEYAASCMRMALRAAKVLDTDHDLQQQWQERIDNLAEGKGESEWRPSAEASEKRHRELNSPSFRPGEPYRNPNKWSFAQRWWGWIDKLTISLMRDVRGGQFCPDSDFTELNRVIRRWRRPNGLVWPMPVRYYGYAGAWTEGLGLIAPVQEMMLQSWDGTIQLFPAWPSDVDCSFNQLRAEGAFLVSASKKNGCICDVMIESLAGCNCVLVNPWEGSNVSIIEDKSNTTVLESNKSVLTFETQKNQKYRVDKQDE